MLLKKMVSKMIKVRNIILALLMALLVTTGLAMPVKAIAEPTTVSLTDIEIFQDLLVTDDFLAIVPYEIAYTTNPSEKADETFIFRLLSPDGTTENGTALATTLYNSGYGHGIVSFYFASGMVWDSSYIFRVQQNPAIYPLAQYWDFVVGPSNYSTATDEAAALKAKILDTASLLTPEFLVALTETSESGSIVLSSYGELYYLDAIPGLQQLCPDLFSVRLESPSYTKRTWSTTVADALKTKYAGTFIEDFMTGSGGLFSMAPSAAMTTLSILMGIVLIFISVWKFKASMLAACTDGYTVLLLLMLMGFFPMVAAGGLAFASVFMGGVILFLNKS